MKENFIGRLKTEKGVDARAKPLAKKGKVDDPAKVDSSAILLLCNSTSKTPPLHNRRPPASSRPPTSQSIHEQEHLDHKQLRNVPQRENEAVSPAHFWNLTSTDQGARSQPQRHAHEASAKPTNTALLDSSKETLLLNILCGSLESVDTLTSHTRPRKYTYPASVKEAKMPAAPATGAAGLLARQLKGMQQAKDLPGISCGLVNDNVFEWEVMLMISDDCKYYGGTYPSFPIFIVSSRNLPPNSSSQEAISAATSASHLNIPSCPLPSNSKHRSHSTPTSTPTADSASQSCTHPKMTNTGTRARQSGGARCKHQRRYY